MKPSAQPFLWEWVLFPWEWKIIFMSKALNLVLIQRPWELGNYLLARSCGLPISCRISIIVQTTKKINITFHCHGPSPGVSWMNKRILGMSCEPAITEAQKRVRTNIDNSNLTEQYFDDVKRGLPRCKNLWTFSLFCTFCFSRFYCVDFFVFFVLRHRWV